jgi:uncharacterized protein (UPF0261 family)
MEYAFLRQCLADHGVTALVVDAGIHPPTGLQPNMPREVLVAAAGTTTEALAAAADRGAAVAAMAEGAERVILELHREGRLDAARPAARRAFPWLNARRSIPSLPRSRVNG